MPDSDEDKDDEGSRAGRDDLSGTVSENLSHGTSHFGKRFGEGERIEGVFSHPCSEGDMPSLPKFGYTPGHERLTEILCLRDTKKFRDSKDKIDSSGEVGVDLYAVEESAHEYSKSDIMMIRIVKKDLVHYNANSVRNDHFFEKSPQHAEQTKLETPQIKAVGFVKLRGELLIAGDRSLNDLGKIGDEQGKLE